MRKDQELLEAARNGDIKIVGKLLELAVKRNGPFASFRRTLNINYQDMNGYTALHHACLNGHSNIVRLLIAHSTQLDKPDIRGSTPLYVAAWAGQQDIVKMLLMQGPPAAVNPNSQTIENDTPLHTAAQNGHNTVVAILLAYGANPCIRNNSFQTALDLAAQFGRLQVVQILLRSHPELIAPYSHMSYTPTPLRSSPTKHIFTHSCLHLASRNGHKKVVEALLNAGVDVNILTNAGSALHEAALCGKKSVVVTLLKAGINIEARDRNGRTALELLNEYPPHVTYDIVTVINEFCAGNIALIEKQEMKTHTLPKCLNFSVEKKANSTSTPQMPKHRNKQETTAHQFGLSYSLSSLNNCASAPESYLKMKPLKGQQNKFDDDAHNGSEQLQHYKPVYKQPYQGAFLQKNKEFANASIPSRSYEFINLLNNTDVQNNQLQSANNDNNNNGIDQSTGYHCVDTYTKMSLPIPSPRSKAEVDYANFKAIKPIAAQRNLNKAHSPTPDYPPPTVTEAEHLILEFMQPLTLRAKSDTLARPENDTANCDFESETPRTLSSAASDFVEQFVGDMPFAGLFKGSTANLIQDEIDGNNNDSLLSPQLVRSIKSKPFVPLGKSSLVKQRYSATGEDFSASKVWTEIETIFENIGNEMQHSIEQDSNNAMETNLYGDSNQTLHIRSPSDLQLTGGEQSKVDENWCHSPLTLIYSEISYSVFYLGSTVIRQLQGTASTRKSIQKLKIDEGPSLEDDNDQELLENCNNSTKYLKAANLQTRLNVGIALSYAGVKFIDPEENNLICTHNIININCVCQDANDLRYFAYITKEQDLHYCHVFMVDNLELAKEIILTLGQAFEVAYQLALSRQCTPTDLE